jgi:2-polyprenyl-3-methyl-5-hydroxy-6-metoxy-1,4-benzoquinol methylase
LTIIRHKSTVYEYYSAVIREGQPTEEGLTEPVCNDFVRLVDSLPDETPRKALDLGYGYGNYSIALARRGYMVRAVDQIPSALFRDRIGPNLDLSRMIEIEELDLECFDPDSSYGIVVAKDVLHFLQPNHVERILSTAVRNAEKHSVHYLVVFADIARRALDGTRIWLEGEAGYTSEQIHDLVSRLYAGWDVEVHWMHYEERERASGDGRCYFQAARATVVAKKA